MPRGDGKGSKDRGQVSERSSHMKPNSTGGCCVPRVEVDTWPGGDRPCPDPTGPSWPFVRCPTHVYPMNIFQEMPSHTWGPGRTQAPDHKMRKGLPLPVCSREPEWDLGLGAERMQSLEQRLHLKVQSRTFRSWEGRPHFKLKHQGVVCVDPLVPVT